MLGFSPADGFIHVKEGVEEMIKYAVNEPSVGLFFVQQHARTSMPYLLDAKDKIAEKIHKVTLHTENVEDSISVVRSMTECGIPIVDEMIREVNKSLVVMSTCQPKKGFIRIPSSAFPAGNCSSDLSADSNYRVSIDQQDVRSSRNYLSALINSAKEKAAGLRWTQPHRVPESHDASTLADGESDELPLSSRLEDGPLDEVDTHSDNMEVHYVSSMLENYDKFRSDREARLEEWLREHENDGRSIQASG